MPPVPERPRPGRVGWWAWVFLALFLAVMGSRLYFLLQPAAPALHLDPAGCRLLARAGATEVQIEALSVPEDGQVLTRSEPPAEPGGPWRVFLEWSPEPSRRAPGTGHTRTFTVLLPPVTEVELIDLRGAVPEHLRLRLPPAGR